ncbi:MAG: FMN-binding negative transcriptional regulator [Pseudomonadales bacterium]
MYIPKHFEATNDEEKYSFIEDNGFGQLVSNSEGRLFSSHIPFLPSYDKTKLPIHLARQNPQSHDIEAA